MTQEQPEDPRLVVVGPDGTTVVDSDGMAVVPSDASDSDERSITDLVEEPAKVMRIGSMIRQLLEEVKSAPLDEAGRTRLAKVIHAAVSELGDGLAPELDEELNRLVEPFESATPSESELRIAQAQLVGWLEGLFHGIQTAIYAQQMAARAQLEQMRALPPGGMSVPNGDEDPGASGPSAGGDGRGGMYL